MDRRNVSRFLTGACLTGGLCLLISGLGSAGAQSEATPAATPGGTPVADTVVANIQYLRYKPNPIEIVAGETVVWINRDALPHTVTSTDGDLLQSETLGSRDEYRQTFATPGTYDYFCLFHAQMKGAVIVTERGADSVADATPTPS